jgi:metal iron transporter
MDRPSKTDEPQAGKNHNQNPPQLSDDLTTNQDPSGIPNAGVLQRDAPPTMPGPEQAEPDPPDAGVSHGPFKAAGSAVVGVNKSATSLGAGLLRAGDSEPDLSGRDEHAIYAGEDGGEPASQSCLTRAKHAFLTFGKFIGPGFMVAVAYSTPTIRVRRSSDWLTQAGS